jgi:acetyltransferase-like isoleucine patch superfamily enzyme
MNGISRMLAEIVVSSSERLGARGLVFGGVTIGDRVAAGGGSVVSKDVAVNSVVGGVPARLFRQHDAND